MQKISCIIPTLGRGAILLDTVKQLIDQRSPPFEILVVDQTIHPDPDTVRKLDELGNSHNVKRIPQTEPNASLARNTGALMASGDVLLYLDDDIKIGRDFLSAYEKAFCEQSVTAVAGQVLEGNGETVEALPVRALSAVTGWLHFPRNYTKPCLTQWMASGNFAVRRAMFLALGGMDANYEKGAFREETDFAMRFIQTGGKFYFRPDASIYHLGAKGAPNGGSRHWTTNKRIAGWHHCVGDWYFTFGYASLGNICGLLRCSLRHFVLNRYNVAHPWWLVLLLFRWLAAAPVGFLKRLKGPRLINTQAAS